MAKSYSAIQKQIDALQAEADKLRREEIGEVIARIKEAISHYGLTSADLFGRGARRTANGGGRTKAAIGSAPRYGDSQGNVWGGRGPRPRWLREALAAGKQLADYEVKPTAAAKGVRAATAPSRKRRAGAIRYRDEVGNTWTGVGRKPRWFVEALANGKKPEDLAVS